MPHIPRRFRPVRGDTPSTKLSLSDQVPPDLLDIYGELPVVPESPARQADVPRNPVVRQRTSRTTGLDRISLKSYGLTADDAVRGLGLQR